MSLETYLRAAPKAELHVHLEGALRPETVRLLAARNGVALAPDVAAGLERGFTFTDFPHFIRTYVAVTRCLRVADDYELATAELGQALAAQGVRYAEVTFSPSTHRFTVGNDWDQVMAGLEAGRAHAARVWGVQLRWVFDVVGVRPEQEADFVTRVAVDGRVHGVVALGAVGLGTDREAAWFAPHVERARAAGLRFTPHAGEVAGAQSVRDAVALLGADRVGHGVRASEDPALVELLAARRVALEVCPISNLRLGIYPGPNRHPLGRLLDAGVPVTVNSDDPLYFGATLTDNLLALREDLGAGPAAVARMDQILLNGARYSFLPDGEKQALVAEMEGTLARLKQEHLREPPA